jgi:hypothetical protein
MIEKKSNVIFSDSICQEGEKKRGVAWVCMQVTLVSIMNCDEGRWRQR